MLKLFKFCIFITLLLGCVFVVSCGLKMASDEHKESDSNTLDNSDQDNDKIEQKNSNIKPPVGKTDIKFSNNKQVDLDISMLSEEDFKTVLNNLGLKGALEYSPTLTLREMQRKLSTKYNEKHINQFLSEEVLLKALPREIIGADPLAKKDVNNQEKIETIIIKNRVIQDNIWHCAFAVAYNISIVNSNHNEIYKCPNDLCVEKIFSKYAQSVNDDSFINYQNDKAAQLYNTEIYGDLVKGEVDVVGNVEYGNNKKFLIIPHQEEYLELLVNFGELTKYVVKRENSASLIPANAEELLKKSDIEAGWTKRLNNLLKDFFEKRINYVNIAAIAGGEGGHYVLVTLTRFNDGKSAALLLLDSSDTKDFGMGLSAVRAVKEKLEPFVK